MLPSIPQSVDPSFSNPGAGTCLSLCETQKRYKMKICAYKYFPAKEKKNIEQEGTVLITSTEQINPCSLPSLNNLCMHVFLRISILLLFFFSNNINVSSWQQFGFLAETKEVRPRFYLLEFWRWRAHWRGVRNYS